MIINLKPGDILSSENGDADLIVGMSTDLTKATGIGIPFEVKQDRLSRPIALGDVLTFPYGTRQLHMLICHRPNNNGWRKAPRHVRTGLDFLWRQRSGEQTFSIVEIGTGETGLSEGARPRDIRLAIENSRIRTDLFVYDKILNRVEMRILKNSQIPPLQLYRIWSQNYGEEIFLD